MHHGHGNQRRREQGSIFSRLIGKYIVKPQIFKNGMLPGYQLPAWAAKAIAPDDTDLAQALQHLRDATKRVLAATELHPYPFFGAMNPTDWQTLLVPHAELHMGFIGEASGT